VSGAMSEAGSVVDVLVQGRASVDLTFLGLTELPRLGEEYQVSGFAMNPGACFITVNALRRLGLRTGFSTDLGNDFFSYYIRDQIREAGIDETFIRYVERDLTEVSAGLSFPHDRTYITWNAAHGYECRRIVKEDLLRQHVRCLFTHVALDEDVAIEARRQGIPICVDAFWDSHFLASPRVWQAIGQADSFLPNLIEARAITHTETAEDALAALAGSVERVAIKLGSHGAIGTDGERIYRVPALPVDSVDTTGAGDNFDAGYMYGLVHGLNFEGCLRCAVVAGSLSTTQPGGVLSSPDETALEYGLAQLTRLVEEADVTFTAE
jgi:sugar/nucleoside kinase (ribokinase family)